MGDRLRKHTIRMKHIPQKLHARRHMRVIIRKFQLCWEHAALERGPLGPLDQAFPMQEVVFGDGARGDAFRWVVGEGAVFLEETTLGYVEGHLDGVVVCDL